MSTSGINGENRIIQAGFAVSLVRKKFRLSGPSLLATHIADSGGLPKGILTAVDVGIVELSSWKSATGNKFIIPGASYCVSSGGRLVEGTTGQVVGTAISQTELSVNVHSSISRAYDVVSFESGAVSVGPLNVGIGSPVGNEGRLGEYRIDLAGLMIYGPKTDYGWGTGRPIADSGMNVPIFDAWNTAPTRPPTNLSSGCDFFGPGPTHYVWNPNTRAWVGIITA